MSIIDSVVTTLAVGLESRFAHLTVFPLLGVPAAASPVLTLDEAIAHGTVRVSEVTESGHVPEIQVANGGSLPVLIIDGEELVGAKQNRTVNLSVLVPPHATVIVPVTCVEAGRWHRRSGHFTAAPRTHFAEGRAAKSRQVTASLRASGRPHADQGQVWDAIANKAQSLDAESSTGAMASIYQRHAATIEEYVRAIAVADDQLGAVFLIGAEARGMELFGTPQMLRTLLPKVVRGYALDAMAYEGKAVDARRATLSGVPCADAQATRDDAALRMRARAFVKTMTSATRAAFPTVGLGETWRLSSGAVSGGALIYDGALLHLAAFAA